MSYQKLENICEAEYCNYCLMPYTIYNVKLDKKTYQCIVNNELHVTLTSHLHEDIIIPYKSIKTIELIGSWNKKVKLILHNEEFVLSGKNMKKMFYQLKNCILRKFNS